MKTQGRIAILAALATCLSVSTSLAQSSQPSQDQQKPQDQNQNDYSGISHPPPDSTIQADQDEQQPAPARVTLPKPSPAVPLQPSTSAPAATTAIPASEPPAAAAAPTNSLDNTDYGIVTVAPARNAASGDASLHTRNWKPDDDLVNYVSSDPNELPAGTNFEIRLSQDLSTADTLRGQSFRGVVARNVYKNGRIIIPVGSGVEGRVVEASQGHHLGPHATLALRPRMIILPDGTRYHMEAEAVQSLAPGTRTNQEGGIEASHHYAKDAIEYGAGTGVGAVAGAEIAGPVGAGVGSLVGASLVSAHMLLQQPEPARLPQGALVIFSLTEPMTLAPTRN